MRRLFSASVLVLAAVTNPVNAQDESLECGTVYEVQRGDSLSKIAQRVYGRTSAYQPIFDFNPGVLTDPNRLAIGVNLYIPCIGADAPSGGASSGGANAAATPAPAPAPLPDIPTSTSERLRILTGSEYPPYVDEGLPNGGFSVELVERSLIANGGSSNYRIDVINDWSSHLAPLLEDGAYDLAFPWFKPDCSKRSLLGESSVWRCDNLRFSGSLHDVVIAFYSMSDAADGLATEEDLQGKRICRPRGYFTHDLEAMGLVDGTYERLSPSSPEDCFTQLAAGEADVVTVNADTSDKILNELNLTDKVAELIDLANVQTLHVVAMRTNPSSRANLLRVSQGLRQLQLNGDYLKIARTHLQ